MIRSPGKAYREVTKSDRKRAVMFIVLTVVVIVLSGAILVGRAWPIGIVVWLLIFVGGSLFLLIRWHARTTAYRCSDCGHEFEISAWTDLLSPHIPDKKHLKCPACGEVNWADVLMKE